MYPAKQRFWCVQHCTKRFPTWKVGFNVVTGIGMILPVTDNKKAASKEAKKLRTMYKASGNKYGYKFQVREMVILG